MDTLTKVMKARPRASAMRSLGMLSAPSITLSDVKFNRVFAAFRISPTMSNVTGELRYLRKHGIAVTVAVIMRRAKRAALSLFFLVF